MLWLPACKSLLTVLTCKGTFFFLWSYHLVTVITATTGERVVAPHLQKSPALIINKIPFLLAHLGNWLYNPNTTKLADGLCCVCFPDMFFWMRMGFSWNWSKTKDKTRLCHPQGEKTPSALPRKSSLCVLQDSCSLTEKSQSWGKWNTDSFCLIWEHWYWVWLNTSAHWKRREVETAVST